MSTHKYNNLNKTNEHKGREGHDEDARARRRGLPRGAHLRHGEARNAEVKRCRGLSFQRRSRSPQLFQPPGSLPILQANTLINDTLIVMIIIL